MELGSLPRQERQRMAFAIRNAENKHDIEAEVLERHYAVSIQHAGRDKITP
jgi:hypothetical protein